MFNKVFAVFYVIFVDPEELRYKNRSLRRLWFVALVTMAIAIAVLGGGIDG